MSAHTPEMRKRRKKLILQLTAVGLVCLLLMRFDFWIWLSNHPGDRTDEHGKISHFKGGDQTRNNVEKQLRGAHRGNRKNMLRVMMGEVLGKTEAEMIKCEIPYLKNIPREQDVKSGGCQRKKSALSSCQLAKELFGDPSRKHLQDVCAHQSAMEFCQLEPSQRSDYHVTCDITKCDDSIYLGTIDIHTAEEIWTKVSSRTSLEKSIMTIMGREHAGYCLIRCGRDDLLGDPKHIPMDMVSEDGDYHLQVAQILILPPFVKTGVHVGSEKLINFNLVFVDSVSRAHFFRSLPKSVQTLENVAMRMNSDADCPVVLDYDLVQAVRSRTFESLQTLFSGSIDPFEKPFGVQSMPKTRLNIKDLLGPLKDMGYTTQWLEDLCPLWEWGIAKDFLVYGKTMSVSKMWNKLRTTLQEVKLDSIGPMLFNCRILHANGHSDPFHGPDRICYNGKQHHDYMLEYLYMYNQEMLKANKAYFNFYETNIGHESSGLRVQLFDEAFSKYLKYVASLDNTITIIFSDHGNAYGDFVTMSSEGRTEMYNPFLFLIIPKKVQTLIGNQHLKTLTGNQHKLISLLDLHYTLKYLIEQLYQKSSENNNYTHQQHVKSTVTEFNKQFNVSNKGLFSPIAESRTCNLIPRIMPNLCICAGYDSRASNYDYNFILAMYVVGQLNNQIQAQRRKHLAITHKKFPGGFGRCLKMEAEKIMDIQRSTDGDLDMIKMDLYVKTPGQQSSEIFFVAVTMTIFDEPEFHLQNMDRITSYSQYSVCADPGVDLSLCVCDLDMSDRNITSGESSRDQVVNNKLKVSSEDIEVAGVNCLKVIQRSSLYGAVLEGFNGCVSSVNIYLVIAAENLVLSPLKGVVMYPGDTTFLVAAVAMDTEKAWDWDIEVNILE